MIIVRLTGGLGNQLFQYALARAVSSRLKTDFRLDATAFDTYYTLHKYSLQNFNVKQQMAKNSDFFCFVWLRNRHKIFDTFYKYLRLKSKLMPFYYPEQMFHFDPLVFSKNGTYFDGFWQTEKYFSEIAPKLRKEIMLAKPLSEYSKNILEKIKNSRAVSIHVRRADYVTDPGANHTFGACSIEYYQKAIAYIARSEPWPHFFVFSDDHAWAGEHFKSLPYPVTCVQNTTEKNYEDLMLMSSCTHNIIANSTFSWWGAWLNAHQDKIVIAPQQWFNAKKSTTDTKDIIPDGWIKL